ncbi:MAG: amidohydrolase [Mariprofundaceae bacterium]
MSISPQNLRELIDSVDQIMPKTIEMRRHFHKYPELSGQEEKTAAFITKQCIAMGLKVRSQIGGHGILAQLCIDSNKPWLAFRADMDALPMQDAKLVPYQSQHTNITHACGHDAHSAILLSTAQILSQIKSQLNYNVAFIFQPAEEICQGAKNMVDDGLFDGFTPKFIYALHVYPYLPSGSIGFRHGTMCAAADMFEIHIQGRGGHAARPHECTDVILTASHIIQALHHIVSRRIHPLHPAVLTIGQINAGHAGNILPDQAYLAGTLRSLQTDVHDSIRMRMEHIICQTAEIWGATARLNIHHATPALINNPEALQHAQSTLSTYMPEIQSIEIDEASMGGEDFAEFLQHIPGCLLRLGTGSTPETRYALHHPCFDIDEKSMRSGILSFTSLALNI